MIIAAPTLPVTPQIANFVRDVFLYHYSLARAEASVSRNPPSTILGVLSAVELGCLGYGHDGTKPVIRTPQDPELRQSIGIDLLGHRRYHNLLGRDLQTADAVYFDGKGIVIAGVAFDRRTLSCTLYQRIGFQIAEQTDRDRYQRWMGKIRIKDSDAAMQGAERLGYECLTSAAKAWFSVE